MTKAKRGEVAFITESVPAFMLKAAYAKRKKGKVALNMPKIILQIK